MVTIGIVRTVVLTQPWMIVMAVAGIFASVPMSLAIARITHAGRILSWFAWIATVALLAATLGPLWEKYQIYNIGQCFTRKSYLLNVSYWPDVFASDDGFLNVLLYLIPGFLWTLVFPRRRWLVPVIGLVMSVTIEISQAVQVAHSCDPADMVTNSTGALVGAGIALAWLRQRAQGQAADR